MRNSINPETEPQPAHVRTLAALQRYATKGFTSETAGFNYGDGHAVQPLDLQTIPAIVYQLCDRVVGTTIPAKDVHDTVPMMIEALHMILDHFADYPDAIRQFMTEDIEVTVVWLEDQAFGRTTT